MANAETVHAVDVVMEKVVDAIKENTTMQADIVAALMQIAVGIRVLTETLEAK